MMSHWHIIVLTFFRYSNSLLRIRVDIKVLLTTLMKWFLRSARE